MIEPSHYQHRPQWWVCNNISSKPTVMLGHKTDISRVASKWAVWTAFSSIAWVILSTGCTPLLYTSFFASVFCSTQVGKSREFRPLMNFLIFLLVQPVTKTIARFLTCRILREYLGQLVHKTTRAQAVGRTNNGPSWQVFVDLSRWCTWSTGWPLADQPSAWRSGSWTLAVQDQASLAMSKPVVLEKKPVHASTRSISRVDKEPLLLTLRLVQMVLCSKAATWAFESRYA